MERPDFFNINSDVQSQESLEDKFSRERLEWNDKIKDMSLKMKKVSEIPELMTYIYTDRQRVVEYYHYIISLMIKHNKKYRTDLSERYDYYTTKSPIRYPNETTKNQKIQADLADSLERREILENHSKFLLECRASLDHIIWAIQKRIELEKILRGD